MSLEVTCETLPLDEGLNEELEGLEFEDTISE